MFHDFDLSALRQQPKVAYYFRYDLHHDDFHEVRAAERLLGRFAVKPLYGRLTARGQVDRSAGFNGQLAILFLPARARSARSAQLLLARMRKDRVTRPDGRRNWPAIRASAERAVRRAVGAAVA